MTISIKALKETSGFWTFSVSGSDFSDGDYSTNSAADGLFTPDLMTQHTGTAQFSLGGCTYSAAYNRIRRYFA